MIRLWLYPSHPSDTVREIRIEHFPFVVGRRSDSDCVLPFAFISRHHCQFTLTGKYVVVKDLESHNGTFVNGQSATFPLAIRHGDEISLGPISFRVVIHVTAWETEDSCVGLTSEQVPGFAREAIPHTPSGSM